MQKQGKPWKAVGVFSSFDEANKKRESLVKRNTRENFELKIHRSGVSGKQYTLKVRYNDPDPPQNKKKGHQKKKKSSKSDK